MSDSGKVDLLIQGGIVLPMDDRTAFEGDVAVKGGEIVALGPGLDLIATEVIDAAGCAVLRRRASPGPRGAARPLPSGRGAWRDFGTSPEVWARRASRCRARAAWPGKASC